VHRSLSLLLMLCLSATSGIFAQTVLRDTTAAHDTLASPARIAASDTSQAVAMPHKSTWMAMGLSMAIPGAGQVYNEAYWKAPLAFGLGIYFISEALRYNRNANDYRQLYFATVESNSQVAASYLSLRDKSKDSRDANIWYFFIVYVLNIVDAYVDASLYGFDVSPTLSYRAPQGTVGLSLRICL
jgi:hypothetical protein